MKKILDFIDKSLRKYTGLDQQDITPDVIKKVGNTWILVNTESHKRHTETQNLDQFLATNMDKLNESSKIKLGASMGAALAKNLVVSFEKVNIKKEGHDA